MKLMPCGKGHFYDGEKHDSCPYCSELREVSSSKAKLEPEIMRDPEGMMVEPAFLYCENGHYYDIWKYDRCPICGTAELWKREKQKAEKEKPPMKLMHCENGHTYNQELYDTCPYCGKQEDESSSDGSFEFFGRPDNRGMYHVEFWDVTKSGEVNRVYGYTTVPPEAGGRPALEIKKCGKGHYFDGNREKVCPYCGDAAAETI